MAKRDYYEVLEVDKTATLDVIKKHTAKKQYNIIRTRIREIKKRKKNSRKLPKLMMC
jgi:hypothetical protein